MEQELTFPDGFFMDEYREGYYVSSNMKKVWGVELDLLNQLLNVCRENSITIFASGGTMLGAVRHRGFIPWDNDIDMMMFRDDYEKLSRIASEAFKPPYFFQTEYTDPGSLRGHAQLRNSETCGVLKEEFGKYAFNQGIFLDIFPLDNVIPDNSLFKKQAKKALSHRKKAFFYSKFSSRYIEGNKCIRQTIKRIIHLLFGDYCLKREIEEYRRFEEWCKKYNDVRTEMVSTLSFKFENTQHFKFFNDYKELIEVPFEFMTIPIGKNYDHALTKRYGNYKEAIQGKNDHGEVIFDTEHSYKEVNGNV